MWPYGWMDGYPHQTPNRALLLLLLLQDRQYRLEMEWAPTVTKGPKILVMTLERGG